jgi:hypothetical protein
LCIEDINTVPSYTHHVVFIHVAHNTTHSTRSGKCISPHLISRSCFPSLLQRLEFGLQPAVFASQGQRIVGTVAETTESQRRRLPSSQFQRSHRSIARWWDGLIDWVDWVDWIDFTSVLQIAYRWLAKSGFLNPPIGRAIISLVACGALARRGREILSVFLLKAES